MKKTQAEPAQRTSPAPAGEERFDNRDPNVIDLVDLIRLLLRSWKLIGFITGLVTAAFVAYALIAPETFKAETLLAPVKEEKAGMPSALSQFGGLAAMAGISIPGDTDKEKVVATLKSRKFITRFLSEQNLLPLLFAEQWNSDAKEWNLPPGGKTPTLVGGYESFTASVMTVSEDKKSGLVTLAIRWKDPQMAADWANQLVTRLNEELRERAIEESDKRIEYLNKELLKTTVKDMREVLYSLLESEKRKAMLANVNEEFALGVLDPAVAPEERESPKRKVIVVLGGLVGGFLGIFAVFLVQFVKRLKSPKFSESSNA